MNALNYPVYSAKSPALRQARQFLKNAGIDSKMTQPRKQCGILKVASSDAEPARNLLQQCPAAGRIITAAEASFFFCHACQAPLSMGSLYCSKCGEFVGDAHAL